MPAIAIRADALGKQYRLGTGPRPTLRETLGGLLRRSRPSTGTRPLLWALKDVSFEVRPGEAIGVIGRNGAGKSTLLKVLSRITDPTEGYVDLYGQVGSLLEVGSGFHPELTGRENVFLNGAILGMRQVEIARHFDAIVAFAEIERFVDTAVKHYSSGMYMRLAFAVAAFLRADVLLVDEVLAVGDLAFQRRCLGKMDEVTRSGRTVVFVSHNLSAIGRLTQRTLWLDQGKVAAYGPTGDVLKSYYHALAGVGRDGTVALGETELVRFRREHADDQDVRFTGLRVLGTELDGSLGVGLPVSVRMEVESRRDVEDVVVSLVIKGDDGSIVATIHSKDVPALLNLAVGRSSIRVDLPSVIGLAPGLHVVDVGIARDSGAKAYDVLLDVPLIEVREHDPERAWPDRRWGAVHLSGVEWRVEGSTTSTEVAEHGTSGAGRSSSSFRVDES